MTAAALPLGAKGVRASRRLAQTVAAYLPALLLAYPTLVSPLLSHEPRLTILSDYEPPDAAAAEPFFLTPIIFPALLMIAAACFALARPRLGRQERVAIGWLAAFLALAFASTLWSLAPGITLNKAAYQTIIVGILVCSATTARDPERILVALFWLMAAVVLVNLGPVLTRPSGVIGHEGIYSQKNTLGTNAAVAVLFGLFAIARGGAAMRLAGAGTVLGALVLLQASDSKTALGLALIVPPLALLIHGLSRAVRIAPVVAVIAGVGMGAAAYWLLAALFGFTQSDVFLLLFGDETFTGRTHIWAFTWTHILERPLLGHGYQGFWGIGPDSPKFSAEPPFIAKMPYAHNGFLDILLELGAAGLAVFMALLILALAYVRRLERFGAGTAILGIGLLVFAIGRNMMESNWFLGSTTVSVLFVLLILLAACPPPAMEILPRRGHALRRAREGGRHDG